MAEYEEIQAVSYLACKFQSWAPFYQMRFDVKASAFSMVLGARASGESTFFSIRHFARRSRDLIPS